MNLESILEKIHQTPIPQGQKVAVVFSGGLDSSLAIELLRRVYHAQEIVPITIDVGQGDEEMQEMHEKAKALNIQPLIIDAKEEFSNEWLKLAILANSDYNGYPVSTSMTRQLVAKLVAQEAKNQGCHAMWRIPPTQAQDTPIDVELQFERGLPIALNGKAMLLDHLIAELNTIAGGQGVRINRYV